ncbi:DNA binding protein putative isoform 2 [Tripterygium wilfordii]|uniref:DNA binding protein putative isoform 2 n=1 Tax=Tripterygium wilfordii TaxID=458696 RepID=A0A7J7CDN3_TRIWF|nr:uncharacterized protein LOC119983842 [Tripterygium wilfordii]KAF5732284.1 DNA binding protein putative isoform 2 [Tripterygium wilfordii]
MNSDDPARPQRKVKFAPKAPPTRKPKSTVQSVPKTEDESTAEAQYLLRRFQEKVTKQKPKVNEKPPSAQVAFGFGTKSSSYLRTYGNQRDGTSGNSSSSRINVSDDEPMLFSSPSTAKEDGIILHASDPADASSLKTKKNYRDPWDYHRSNYPITLPLRRPYSGDPELLDEADFGEAARNKEYDENTINPASDLGLLEESTKEKMFFFQLPAKLPFVKRLASAKGKEKAESSGRKGAPVTRCSLEELPEGYMGKMLVYKSGAIKLKLGDCLYDVSPGSDCIFAQDAVAINTVDKNCCVLGELGKRATVAPNVDYFLDSVIDLN